jgi:hypothetical protein
MCVCVVSVFVLVGVCACERGRGLVLFKLLKYLTDFLEIFYEYYAFERHDVDSHRYYLTCTLTK